MSHPLIFNTFDPVGPRRVHLCRERSRSTTAALPVRRQIFRHLHLGLCRGRRIWYPHRRCASARSWIADVHPGIAAPPFLASIGRHDRQELAQSDAWLDQISERIAVEHFEERRFRLFQRHRNTQLGRTAQRFVGGAGSRGTRAISGSVRRHDIADDDGIDRPRKSQSPVSAAARSRYRRPRPAIGDLHQVIFWLIRIGDLGNGRQTRPLSERDTSGVAARASHVRPLNAFNPPALKYIEYCFFRKMHLSSCEAAKGNAAMWNASSIGEALAWPFLPETWSATRWDCREPTTKSTGSHAGQLARLDGRRHFALSPSSCDCQEKQR